MILMPVYVSGGYEEIAGCLLVFDMGKGADIGYKTWTLLVRMDGNFNEGWYISGSLHLVIVFYLRSLINVIFLHDNESPHINHSVLTFLDTQGIRLLL